MRAGFSPSKRSSPVTCDVMRLHPGLDHLALVQRALGRLAARVADQAGGPADHRDRMVPRLLQPAHGDQLHQVAEMQRRMRWDRSRSRRSPAPTTGHDRSAVSSVRQGQQPAPAQVVEDLARHGRLSIGKARAVLSSATDVPPPGAEQRLPRPARPPAAAHRAVRRRGPAVLPMVIMAAFVALAGALFIGLMGVYAAYTNGLPPVEDLENFTLDEGSRVVSADGVRARHLRRRASRGRAVRRDPAAPDRCPGGRRGRDLLGKPVHRLARHRARRPPEPDSRGAGVRRLDHLPAAGPHSPLRRRPDGRPRPPVRAKDQGVDPRPARRRAIRRPTRAKSASSRCT